MLQSCSLWAVKRQVCERTNTHQQRRAGEQYRMDLNMQMWRQTNLWCSTQLKQCVMEKCIVQLAGVKMLFLKMTFCTGAQNSKTSQKWGEKKYSKELNLIISKSRGKTQLINHLNFFSPLGGHRGIGNACKIRSNLLSNGLKNRPHLFHSACLDINKNSVFYICFPAWFIAILLSSNQFVCFTGSPPPPAPSCSMSCLGKAVLHPAVKHGECSGVMIPTTSEISSTLRLNMPIKCL